MHKDFDCKSRPEKQKSFGTGQDVQTGQFSDRSRSPSRQNNSSVSHSSKKLNRNFLRMPHFLQENGDEMEVSLILYER